MSGGSDSGVYGGWGQTPWAIIYLGKWKLHTYLTRESFVTCVRSALTAAGYNASDYAGHSF